MLPLGWLKHDVLQTQIEHWLSEEVRPVLAAYPGVGDHLQNLSVAYDIMLKNQPLEDTEAGRKLLALRQKAETLDLVHDTLARGEDGLLGALAELAYQEPAVAARYQDLRAKLFPHGLAIVNWAYDREATEMNAVEARLNAADWQFMTEIVTPQGTLKDTHKVRHTATRALAKVDRQIKALEVEIKATRISADQLKAN